MRLLTRVYSPSAYEPILTIAGGHATCQYSFTNTSLYTSFASKPCFYKQPIEDAGAIDNHLGLDRLQDTPPEIFWSALRERLHARSKDLQNFAWPAKAKTLVVVAGEAANHPEFLSIVKTMSEGLPEVVFSHKSQNSIIGTGAELVVPEDPALAPATGAALWSRLKVESGSYCEESDDCCQLWEPMRMYSPAWEVPREKDEL